MKTKVYLFDAKGYNRQLDLSEVNLEKINENQLIWINILGREREAIEKAVDAIGLKNVPVESILNISERPKIDTFENFYRFFIVSVKTGKNGNVKRLPIDFLIGKNYVISVHNEEIPYFKEFSELEEGETHIGELDAESFVASLLDLHIVSYFFALEKLEEEVDKLDSRVLETEIEADVFLAEMVELRKSVSNLRRWFLPHRDVFYALSRPDFHWIAQSDSAEHFKMLNQHFENAVDAIESSRDTVLSLFALYATKSSRMMNVFIQRLTFITLLVGALGAVAGVWGMNFEVEYFKSAEYGFWLTIGGMTLVALSLTVLAKFKRWI